MRLIDADALLDEMGAGCLPIFEKGISDVTGDEDSIKDYVDRAPTVDAVYVVRCKDCKWLMPGQVCILRNVGVRNDFFCASGAMAILSGGGGGAAD